MTVHAYTSFSFSYLNRARVWAASLRKQHPDWVIWAVITDKEPDGFHFDVEAEDFDRAIYSDELFGDSTDRWLFGHDIVEACTAVKGRAMLHLMDQKNCTQVFYFDPDTAVFNTMGEVSTLLEDYSIVLTPHQVAPDDHSHRNAIHDNEIASLNYGVFNLGFIAVANDAEARRFATWWDQRLYDWCHDRLDIGVFVDQKWCNLVPCFFDDVKVLRDPGYNVASWNLSNRRMSFEPDGTALINGRPMRFYHFTKLGPLGDVMTQRYARDNVEIYELWWWYKNAVDAATDKAIPDGWWFYKSFDDGRPIPAEARRLYRERIDLQNAFPDATATGEGSYQEWLVGNTDIVLLD